MSTLDVLIPTSALQAALRLAWAEQATIVPAYLAAVPMELVDPRWRPPLRTTTPCCALANPCSTIS